MKEALLSAVLHVPSPKSHAVLVVQARLDWVRHSDGRCLPILFACLIDETQELPFIISMFAHFYPWEVYPFLHFYNEAVGLLSRKTPRFKTYREICFSKRHILTYLFSHKEVSLRVKVFQV